MAGRVVLLLTSPRQPAGLLSASAWDAVRAHRVSAAAESEQVAALRTAGVDVSIMKRDAAELLAAAVEHGTVVWLAGPDGDGDLRREVELRAAGTAEPVACSVLRGSWDPPGGGLLDAVAVVDRLARPGGDPWLRELVESAGSRAQVHRRLAPYLLEEAYEAYDAIEGGDPAALREELGDVLFQVLLHASLASLAAPAGFTIDEVAADLAEKLIRRNPHVFQGVAVTGVDEITENWEQIKRVEKSRDSAMDGIVLSQPALALAAKVLARAERTGIEAPLPRPAAPESPTASRADPAEALGARLFALVAQGRAEGVDAEAALRRAVMAAIAEVRRAEAADRAKRAS